MALAVLLACSAAHAAGDQSLASAIVACSSQTDEKAQLACYNGIAAQLKAAETATPASQTTAQPAPAPQAAAPTQEGGRWYDPGSWFASSKPERPPRPMVGNPADFGSENLPEEKSNAPEPLDHISARVASASYNFFRHFTVTLDNGQVWRQLDSDDRIARFGDSGGEAVTILRGFLGAFSLTIDGHRGSYQVKRIK